MSDEKEPWWSVVLDIAYAFVAVMFIGIVVSLLLRACVLEANASEIVWIPDYPVAWIGTEYNLEDDNYICHDDGNGWQGNVGVRQPIADYGPVRMNGLIQHHSCAFGSDNNDYNAAGINLEFHFGKLFRD